MSCCNSCGASVVWARTAATGKAMPLDAAPVDAGNIVLRDGLAHYVTPGHGHYVSHFATCPQATRWRKPDAKARDRHHR